ncbi:phosphohistidine phosphatase SixA [Pseudomonas nicosulfuronedens]|uniref:Phosphohistidine phosphatase SixA n=1 Tax=Pseudomonas nicosulfuronedens TaxID=2571105 RepID=A0A5R9QUS9_9PSED|nr:phosphohistidine phosphatase SixA [Pseudomonas nicosulfuronedens]MDH1011151.1 phosphohistidine phosphatase SixA [Pseudomonas nicosulfuronedens]MDH1981254.1 phosphohistidine phosphatase SixA [Pseudomonas nicosulfuronedens]MDH2029280.1 phosphohistidine phosphatase SixA [Pseudomonas nicosulfuronedens]TLX73843.1 phosphohistidine phosphatase SixA [Pseudomonas nicosulfuronedens]
MKLWLLRHGEAEPQARRDSERRLTAHGIKEALKSAAQLAGHPLDGILASPYVRAQETAELVREALGFEGSVGTAPWLTPDDDPKDVLRFLDGRNEQNLLLVTHQPLVGALAGLLVHGSRSDAVPFSTATLAELEGEVPVAGLMELVSLYHPRHS